MKYFRVDASFLLYNSSEITLKRSVSEFYEKIAQIRQRELTNLVANRCHIRNSVMTQLGQETTGIGKYYATSTRSMMYKVDSLIFNKLLRKEIEFSRTPTISS
jgi:hypothetical protein